jgi:hypothetical protein
MIILYTTITNTYDFQTTQKKWQFGKSNSNLYSEKNYLGVADYSRNFAHLTYTEPVGAMGTMYDNHITLWTKSLGYNEINEESYRVRDTE